MHLPMPIATRNCPTRAADAAVCDCRVSRSGCGRTSAAAAALENAREMVLKSFDHGITHFDLANNYGPPPGSAEENFGRILATDLAGYRDELVISTKAGYLMWPGPYGEWGSRKYLLASLDQSLERMGLDYVDIFYSHRYDPDTPLEETMGALDTAVRSGRALYVGISSYGPQKTREAAAILRELKTPCIIHQPSYSMLNRWVEKGLLEVLRGGGPGLHRVLPAGAGAAHVQISAVASRRPHERRRTARSARRGQRAQPRQCPGARWHRPASAARPWRRWPSPGYCGKPAITSALIGASRWAQVEECLGALTNLRFTDDELARIDRHALDGSLNIWSQSSEHG